MVSNAWNSARLRQSPAHSPDYDGLQTSGHGTTESYHVERRHHQQKVARGPTGHSAKTHSQRAMQALDSALSQDRPGGDVTVRAIGALFYQRRKSCTLAQDAVDEAQGLRLVGVDGNSRHRQNSPTCRDGAVGSSLRQVSLSSLLAPRKCSATAATAK